MGFLRVKTVKGHQYVYWCQRVRSRKKSGGDGKVKCPDIFLGGSGIVRARYLPFYFFTSEVPLREYAEAVVVRVFERISGESFKISDTVNVQIDWSNSKIRLRFKDKRFDARSKTWRYIRQLIEGELREVIQQSELVQDDIESSAYFLAEFEANSKEALAKREKLENYRRNPENQWSEWELVQDSDTGRWERQEVIYSWVPDADIILDEAISDYDKAALWNWDNYQKHLNLAIDYAPPQRKKEFSRTVQSQIEKLAKDTRWVERYKMQLESTS